MEILLTTSKGSWVSQLIKILTKSDVSHLIMVDPYYKNVMLHSTSKGVHFSHIKKLHKYNVVHRFKLKLDYDDIKAPYKKILRLLESKYDFCAIIGFILSMIGIKNSLGKRGALYCSEILYVFLNMLIKKNLIPNILKDYQRELFSPKDAYQIMIKNPDVFKLIKD